MYPTMFPRMSTTPIEPLSPVLSFALAELNLLISWIALCILLWDWAWNLQREKQLAWHQTPTRPHGRVYQGESRWKLGPGWMRSSFLLSRYLAILQALLVVTVLSLGKMHPGACNFARGLPFGFAVVSFSAHLFMLLRIYTLYNRPTLVLFSLFSLAVIDLGAQLIADTFILPVFLRMPMGFGINVHTCYLTPSSPAFALAFLSPTLFHHIILILTLFASWRHLHAERALGTSVMKVLRRDQVFFVLTVCLVNFTNVVLVLQPHAKDFRLINFFPAMCLTQIFLGRIYFSLRTLARQPSTIAGGTVHSLTMPDSPATLVFLSDTVNEVHRSKKDIPHRSVSTPYHLRPRHHSLSTPGGALDVRRSEDEYARYEQHPSPQQGFVLGGASSTDSSFDYYHTTTTPTSSHRLFDPHPSPPPPPSPRQPPIGISHAQARPAGVPPRPRRSSIRHPPSPILTRQDSQPPLTSFPPRSPLFHSAPTLSTPTSSGHHHSEENDEEEEELNDVIELMERNRRRARAWSLGEGDQLRSLWEAPGGWETKVWSGKEDEKKKVGEAQ